MNGKALQFNGQPGNYFGAAIVAWLCCLIPIFGWPLAFNTIVNWFANNLLVDGRTVKYSGEYGETLVFLLKNFLLILITFGIYTFWYVPKAIRFVADRTTYTS